MSVRTCRICGCTDTQACEGGCWWVGTDLCSACRIPALSILQPWAWLIVNGFKDIENRTWRTHHRGRILVHAGKRWGPEQRADLAHVRAAFPDIPLPDAFELGGLLGSATITDCVSQHSSPWFVGDYGFVIADARPMPFRPCRGKLGFFKPDMRELCHG